MHSKILVMFSLATLCSCGATENCGSDADQKTWVRARIEDIYFWYDKVRNDKDITDVASHSPTDYFYDLTRNSVSDDHFSFAIPANDVDGELNSGIEVSYGLNLRIASATSLVVLFAEPNSPAGLAGISRGAQITQVNGEVPVQQLPNGQLATTDNARKALYSATVQQTLNLLVKPLGSSTEQSVMLTPTAVTRSAVFMNKTLDVSNVKVGYLLYNEFLAASEQPLIDALTKLKADGVTELVLDLRYNGGGYTYLSNQLSYMIGGSTLHNQIFSILKYNNKHTADNEVDTFQEVGGEKKQPLPQLGLSRVFVLTSGNTCSASELVINGLKPFVQVIQVGTTTCGKPYGMLGRRHCNTTYFPIAFSSVNAREEGGYASGIVPDCVAADLPTADFGSVDEPMLSAALSLMKNGTCTKTSPLKAANSETSNGVDSLIRSTARENMFRSQLSIF